MPSRRPRALRCACRSASVVLSLALSTAPPAPAAAQEPPSSDPAPAPPVPDRIAQPDARPPRNFAVDVGVATEFPISVGGYAGVELPGRFLVQLGAGVMPGPYANAINGVLVGAGAYDATIGNFLQSAISSSFALRLSAGWRPFRDHGFEVLGGYTLLTLGGSATEGQVINAVLSEVRSSQQVMSSAGATIPLSATLHNVHVTLGWRWLVASDHVVLRASLSYLQCVGASLNATLPSSASSMQTAVNQDLNSLVAPYFTSYVKTPLIGFSAAYRF